MENSLDDLLKNFGVPKIVIPNEPRILYDGGGHFTVGNNPEIEVRKQVYHRRFKHGESEFLAVKSRIETWTNNENLLLEHLEKENLKAIEFVYRYKGTRTWDYSTEDWKGSKVSVATDADVESLSHEELLGAIREKRVLWVAGWSSMGDKYVDFRVCSADILPKDQGYHFLFDEPYCLTDAMLVGMGNVFEWEEEFFNCYSHYFSRPFLLDK